MGSEVKLYMTRDNVIPLKGQNQPVQGVKRPDANIIKALSELLQEAMDGELVGIAIAMEYYDASAGHMKMGVVSVKMIGALQRLSQQMCRDLD